MEASYYLQQKFSVTTHRNLISALRCHVPTVTENVPTVTANFLAFISKQDVGIACKNDLFKNDLFPSILFFGP